MSATAKSTRLKVKGAAPRKGSTPTGVAKEECKVIYDREGTSSFGDPSYILNLDGSDALEFDNRGKYFAPVMLPDGTEARLGLTPRNYTVGGPGKGRIIFHIWAEYELAAEPEASAYAALTAAASASTGGYQNALDAITAAIASGNRKVLAAVYVGMGHTPKKAEALAAAIIPEAVAK